MYPVSLPSPEVAPSIVTSPPMHTAPKLATAVTSTAARTVCQESIERCPYRHQSCPFITTSTFATVLTANAPVLFRQVSNGITSAESTLPVHSQDSSICSVPVHPIASTITSSLLPRALSFQMALPMPVPRQLSLPVGRPLTTQLLVRLGPLPSTGCTLLAAFSPPPDYVTSQATAADDVQRISPISIGDSPKLLSTSRTPSLSSSFIAIHSEQLRTPTSSSCAASPDYSASRSTSTAVLRRSVTDFSKGDAHEPPDTERSLTTEFVFMDPDSTTAISVHGTTASGALPGEWLDQAAVYSAAGVV
ncbi:hypothetical protein MMC14_010160 [Varicellaria rhodocarpa]|nr:hypothetical protein [Varicellaria rhodocarpa]